MKVIIPPIYEREISGDNPFSVDAFRREPFANALTNLFKNTNDGMVVTINAAWGDGKTTFIRLWERKLAQDDFFIPIYYDAYKNDFTGDAFLSIAALIQSTLESRLEKLGIDSKNEKLDKLKKMAIELGKFWFKKKTGVDINEISDVLNELSDLDVEQRFKEHTDLQKMVQLYQDQLRNILIADNNDTEMKIVFFIDELDRCRPSFTIQVIEKIKHLFDIENVFFVLAINKEQLQKTIESAYGIEGKEASIYLQKFVHVDTQLPTMEGNENYSRKETIRLFLEDLIKVLELESYFEERENILKALSELMSLDHFDLNPRSIERVISLIAIFIASSDEKNINRFLYYIAPMAALKIGDQNCYEKSNNGKFIQGSFEKNITFNWFKKYFEEQKDDTATNVFEVNSVSAACRILDIYNHFPNENIQNPHNPEGEI